MNHESHHSAFRITLKRPTFSVYSGTISRLKIPSPTGILEIGAHHCTLFQVVSAGWIEAHSCEGSDILHFLSSGGILEILHDHAILSAFQLLEAHQHKEVEVLLSALNLSPKE